MKELDRLHPDFYPFPVTTTPKGEVVEAFLHKEGNFLKKADLIALYGKCGDHLHRGSLKKLLSAKTPVRTNFPDLLAFGQKIWNLLGHHVISRLSGSPLICVLKNLDNNNRVEVSLLRPGPPPS
jgi:hypothetical protein